MACKYLKWITNIKENKRLLQSRNKNTRSHIENSQKLIRKVRKKRINITLVSALLTFHSSKFHLPCAYIKVHQNPDHNEFVLDTLTKPAFTGSKSTKATPERCLKFVQS